MVVGSLMETLSRLSPGEVPAPRADRPSSLPLAAVVVALTLFSLAGSAPSPAAADTPAPTADTQAPAATSGGRPAAAGSAAAAHPAGRRGMPADNVVPSRPVAPG